MATPKSQRTRTAKAYLLLRIGSLVVAVGMAMALVGCESPKVAPPSSSPPAESTNDAAGTSPTPSSGPVRGEVTQGGFEPARVVVDVSRSLVFRRITQNTCATAVVFPSLGIEKALPLNTDVLVQLPPTASGELGFQCGMGMDRGKAVVRLAGG